jgi:hypothetical protein
MAEVFGDGRPVTPSPMSRNPPPSDIGGGIGTGILIVLTYVPYKNPSCGQGLNCAQLPFASRVDLWEGDGKGLQTLKIKLEPEAHFTGAACRVGLDRSRL